MRKTKKKEVTESKKNRKMEKQENIFEGKDGRKRNRRNIKENSEK